jgi:uncharacterized protein (DUF2141 family)
MRNARWISVAAAAAGLITSCNLARAAVLDVQVTHLRPTRTVTVSVFRDASSWAQGEAPVLTREFKALAPTQILHLEGLPAGRYAVRVDQQRNSSSLEMPNFSLERHGYSGSATSWMRPTFERAAIEVGEAGAQLTVHLFTAEQH